jgi:1-acyl-sn-glycerol-3-phosphate acyltransferase
MPEIRYPRNILVRQAFRLLGRVLLRILTRIEIEGMESYPRQGRLIIVANHSGVMETVLMTCFAPRQIEYMGSVDIPHEPQMALFMNAYKFIPVFRGNVSLSAMRMGIDVLNQEGVIGLFPEGGIWEPAIRKAQAGVAWMSYHGRAPVLPIGFSPTAGTLGKALRFKRPILKMRIGDVIPAVALSAGIPRKQQLDQAAQHIMDSVWRLVPEEDRQPYDHLLYETFEFEITLQDAQGDPIPIPENLQFQHGPSLSKILYRTTLINNFQHNLKINIQPLKTLPDHPSAESIQRTTADILAYLQDANPYYFTYRYGQEEGTRMQAALQEFHDLAAWAATRRIQILAVPIRRYRTTEMQHEVIETQPIELAKW